MRPSPMSPFCRMRWRSKSSPCLLSSRAWTSTPTALSSPPSIVRLCWEKTSGNIYAMKKQKKSDMVIRGQLDGYQASTGALAEQLRGLRDYPDAIKEQLHAYNITNSTRMQGEETLSHGEKQL